MTSIVKKKGEMDEVHGRIENFNKVFDSVRKESQLNSRTERYST